MCLFPTTFHRRAVTVQKKKMQQQKTDEINNYRIGQRTNEGRAVTESGLDKVTETQTTNFGWKGVP